MTMTHAEIDALATRFFNAIERGDGDEVRACFAPAAEIWHNTDGLVQQTDEVLRVLGWLARNVEGLRYDDVRRDVFDGGFVELHVLRGTRADGVEIALDACVVCRVADGVVTRVDEYLDPRAVEAAFTPA